MSLELAQEKVDETVSSPIVKAQLWTRDFILILLSTVAVYLAFHSLVPTLPIYISEFGGSTEYAGLAMGLLTASAVIIRPFAGWALDGYGRKLIFLGGLLLFLLPSVVYIGMVPLTILLLMRFIQGFGWGICNTAAATVASDLVPPSRIGEGLGYYSLCSAFSMALAPAMGLWLMDNFSFRIMFITGAILIVISIGLTMTIKYPRQERRPGGTKVNFIEKTAIRPAVVILLITVTYGALLSFLPLFTRQQGLGSAGVFFTTLALTTLITRPLSGRIVDGMGRRGYDLVVLPGIFSMVAAMFILDKVSSLAYLIIGGILYGIGFGFLQPTMLALCIIRVDPSKRGAANATYWTAFDVGLAVGSAIWGVVVNAFGYSMMFNLSVIPTLLALVAYFKLR